VFADGPHAFDSAAQASRNSPVRRRSRRRAGAARPGPCVRDGQRAITASPLCSLPLAAESGSVDGRLRAARECSVCVRPAVSTAKAA
jgi:hypothetical protein